MLALMLLVGLALLAGALVAASPAARRSPGRSGTPAVVPQMRGSDSLPRHDPGTRVSAASPTYAYLTLGR